MPAKKCIGLNNVNGLFPELGTPGEQNDAETVTMGEQRPFHLSMENDQLLAQQRISTIRSVRPRVRFERAPEIKDRVVGLAQWLMSCSS